jgi:LPS-assembly protein
VTRGGISSCWSFNDLKPNRDPRSLQYYQDVAGAPGSILDERRGFRGSLNGFVTQALGGYWSARVDVNLVSDSAVVKDTVTDVAQQANQYLRSSAVLSRRTDDSLFTIEATAQQDTFWGGFSVLDGDRWPYPLTGLDPHQDNTPLDGSNRYPYSSLVQGANRGQWLRGPATLQKLPDVRLALPWRPLGEHFSWSFAAGFTRLAPFNGHSGDEGIDGLYQQPNPPAVVPIVATRCGDPGAPPPCQLPQYQFPQFVDTLTQGDRVRQPGEREARMRLDLVPRLSASFALGDWLRIRPTIWIRQDAYLGEVTHDLDQRGYAVGDLLVSSEVSRTFSNGLRHAIQPSVEYRVIPGQWGAVPGNTPSGPNQPVENRFYDEVDGCGCSKTPLHQGWRASPRR